MGLVVLLSALALAVARRLHLGYVGALEGSIHRQAGPLPDPTDDDAAAWLQTVGGFDLSGIRSRLAIPTDLGRVAEPLVRRAAPAAIETPLDQAIHHGNAEEVNQALADPLRQQTRSGISSSFRRGTRWPRRPSCHCAEWLHLTPTFCFGDCWTRTKTLPSDEGWSTSWPAAKPEGLQGTAPGVE